MNKANTQHFALVPHTNFLFMVVYEVLLKCMNSDDVVDTVHLFLAFTASIAYIEVN